MLTIYDSATLMSASACLKAMEKHNSLAIRLRELAEDIASGTMGMIGSERADVREAISILEHHPARDSLVKQLQLMLVRGA